MKGLKTGLTILSVVGGIAGGVTAVTNVVEQYNYENVHEINIVDVYKVNGEEVDYEDWLEIKGVNDATKTSVHNTTTAVIDENEVVIYYGVTDDIPTSTEGLTFVCLPNMPSSFTKNIAAGHGEGRYAEGQYIVVAIPEEYELVSVITPGVPGNPFSKINVDGWDIFYLDEPVDDRVGNDYTFNFEK